MQARTCPGYIVVGGKIDTCPACMAGREHRPAPSNAQRTCADCGNVDCRAWLDCVFCGGAMLTPGDMQRPCVRCGALFPNTSGSRRYCDPCTPRETILERERRKRPKPAPVVKEKAVACATCRHGCESTASESGYECLIVAAGRCRPFAGASLYVAD